MAVKRKGQLRIVEAVLAVFIVVAVLLMVMNLTRPLRSPYIRETSDLRRLAYNVLSSMAQSGTFESTLSERIWLVLNSGGKIELLDERLWELELLLSLSLPPGILYRLDVYLLNTSGGSVKPIYIGTASNFESGRARLTEAEPTTFTYTLVGAKRMSLRETFEYSSLPSFIRAVARGSPNTRVSLSADGYARLLTQVDSVDDKTYGYAAAIYDFSDLGLVPAAGFKFNISGYYSKDSIDRQNNLAYVSVGVDTDFDDVADFEYVYYRYDISSSYVGSLVSIFVNQGSLICTVPSGGYCTSASEKYKVFNIGPMNSGSESTWSGILPITRGKIVGVAFVVVDGGYAEVSGSAGDFWINWDNFTCSWSFEYVRGVTLQIQLTLGYAG